MPRLATTLALVWLALASCLYAWQFLHETALGLARTVAHIALAALTALSWIGAGALLLWWLPPSGVRTLDLLNRLGAGALGFALLTFAAGLAGLLYTAAYLPLFAATAAGGVVAVARTRLRLSIPHGWPRWELALSALVGLYVVVALLATAAPITSTDALAYHAAAPAIFERAREVTELPWSWQSYQPFTVEMLMLGGELLWDSVQGAYAPLLLGLAALAAVAGAALDLAGRTVAVLAAAVFFAQPFMLWATTSAFVEPALAFFLALAAWNATLYLRRGDIAALGVAGVFAGAGAATKYIGIATAGALACAVVLAARRRPAGRALAAFAIPAVLVALPWYVKNLVQTGDPVYPLLAGGPNAAAEESRRQILEGYGAGHGLLDAVLLPLRLLARGEEFDRGDFASPLYLMFAPLVVLDRRARRVGLVVLGAAALYVAAWFVSSQQARFLLPLMAPLALAAGVGIRALAARDPLARVASAVVVAGALAAGAAVTVVYASQFAGVVVGTTSRDAYLARKAIYYDGAKWLSDNLPRDAKVLYGPATPLYVEREVEGWTLDALAPTAGPAETRAYFRRVRPTHAAVIDVDVQRLRQLEYVGARRIASVTVHQVLSRTRDVLGPSETLAVFSVPPPRP